MAPEAIDDGTMALYLEVPGSNVVLLQAFFELYEGVGLVRTLDIRKSLVCVLTTPSLLEDCQAILREVKPIVRWRTAATPSAAQREHFLGYFRERQSC